MGDRVPPFQVAERVYFFAVKKINRLLESFIRDRISLQDVQDVHCHVVMAKLRPILLANMSANESTTRFFVSSAAQIIHQVSSRAYSHLITLCAAKYGSRKSALSRLPQDLFRNVYYALV